MIYKSTHPLSPLTTIRINDVYLDYSSVSEFHIELTENEHDIATIIINGPPSESVTDYFNAAVYLVIDSGLGRRQEFTGYVVSAEPVNYSRGGKINNSYIQEMRLQCLGASFLMKEVSSRVWEYPTLENIVYELAKKYKFSASYPNDSFKPIRMVQANESDWAFLRRVVQTYGYSMLLNGSHLHIWDVSKSTRRIPSYHILTTVQSMVSEHPGNVLHFEAQLGHHSVAGNSSRLFNTSLDSQGNIVEFNSKLGELKDTRAVSTSLFETPIKQTYQSLMEAERAVEGHQRYQTLFNATAEVTAGAGIIPGGVVSLTGYGGEFDGIWYVSNVLHKLRSNMYTTELKLHKNNKKSEEVISGEINVMKDPPEAVLVNGRWVSSDAKIESYYV